MSRLLESRTISISNQLYLSYSRRWCQVAWSLQATSTIVDLKSPSLGFQQIIKGLNDYVQMEHHHHHDMTKLPTTSLIPINAV